MTQPCAAVVGRRPDRRLRRSRQTVLDAAGAILVEYGPAAFTVDAVVERAGVAKSTIYRQWPSRSSLLAAAIGRISESKFGYLDTGSLREDLLAFFRKWASNSRGRDSRLQSLPGLLEAAKRDPDLDQVVQAMMTGLLSTIRGLLERAKARNQIREDGDLDVLTNLLFGALFVPRVCLGKSVSDKYIVKVVDMMAEGYAPSARSSRARPETSTAPRKVMPRKTGAAASPRPARP